MLAGRGLGDDCLRLLLAAFRLFRSSSDLAYFLITSKSSFTFAGCSLERCDAHCPIASPSIAAVITVASGTFGTCAFSFMNLLRYLDNGSSSCWTQFNRSLVVFAPDWCPWKVASSSAFACCHVLIESGLSDIYHSWATSSTAMISNLASVELSRLAAGPRTRARWGQLLLRLLTSLPRVTRHLLGRAMGSLGVAISA